MYVQVLEGQGHCQFPVNLQSWQSSIPSGKKRPVLRAGAARLGLDLLNAQDKRPGQRSYLASRDGPANWPVEQKPPRILFPPVYHRPDPLDSTIQAERGIRMYIFCLRGRRTVEQRKKNKLSLALSAVSWGSLFLPPRGPAALFSFPAAPLRL